jgi:alkaline phosphatase D
MIGILLAAAAAAAATSAPAASPSPSAIPPVAVSAGPMAGFADANEVRVWVQMKAAATVQIRYWPVGQPADVHTSAAVRTLKPTAFTAHLVADVVKPGTKYEYRLLVDGKEVGLPQPLRFQTPANWRWRTAPPDFTVALGSCAYTNDAECDRIGPPYGGEYKIFKSIAGLTPDLMLWLGDNVYYRECEYSSRAGMLKRFTQVRALPELQGLLGITNHVAIWDDHDYGPDDSDRSFILKDASLDVFRAFWENPTYGTSELPGITTTFEWSDVQFFLTDDRFFRSVDTRHTGERTMLGHTQFEWLIDALKKSEATWKLVVVGSQVLNPVEQYETYAHHFPAEREKLLKAIAEENIPGVVFLTGDRHFSSLSRLEREGTYPLYDLTVSPLTSGVASDAVVNEKNPLLVSGSVCAKRNFATLQFSGLPAERRMTITIYDADGHEQWNRSLTAAELRVSEKP